MPATPRLRWHLIVVTLGVVAAASVALPQHMHQTFAPHEINNTDAPPAITWSTPELPEGPLAIDSAEERHLRIDMVVRHLEQPWSIAFLPDGAMLITERVGRLRVVRDGRLDPEPVAGVPKLQTGGPRGLQGLMDVVLHPEFAQNQWVYPHVP